MKALIFNSGLGSRLGALTAERPKSMVRLGSGETIFHRQLRILVGCGIREFVVTTGPYAEMLEDEVDSFRSDGCSFEFVPNPVYAETNYIYSMWLAREHLRGDDVLMLHGDLVFDAAYAQMVIDSPLASLGSINATLPMPEKDFKARVVDGEVREVSVSIFDGDCVAFQPFYKLSAAAMGTWLVAVERFVEAGDVKVYAENAANTVFADMGVAAYSYEGHFVEEVDTPADLERVLAGVRLHDFACQPVFRVDGSAMELICGFAPTFLRESVGGCKVASRENAHKNAPVSDPEGSEGFSRGGDLGIVDMLAAFGASRPLVVSGSHFGSFSVSEALEKGFPGMVRFGGFSPNPTYQEVCEGVAAFRAAGCDSLVSVGGGSAIDVAKCVKQLLAMPEGADGQDFKSSPLPYSGVPHVAVPTTAGTGSESTHFAVCYVDGVKVSVANDCLLPDAVVLDSSNLAGLSDYQRKCTLLDALCQAVESYWSARSCPESRAHSAAAIPVIMACAGAYLAGEGAASAEVMLAANRAGKAINLTTTTAPHAMSYKLTSLYGIPHGHAVALCMPYCWRVLLDRGDAPLLQRLADIAALMTGDESASPLDGLAAFERLFDSLGLESNVNGKCDDVDALVSSVNVQRLSNFPIELSSDDLEAVYRAVVQL